MTAMKRAAAVLALVATVIVAAWLTASVSAQRTRTTAPRSEWPMGLGALDEVPKRYPARVASNDAQRLVALAAAAGVDMATPPAGPRTDRPWLSRWVEAQLTRADLGLDPPPPELAPLDAPLAELRAYLVGRTAIIWPTDLQAAAQAPIPNLYGHLTLTRLLIAHALTTPATASEDLCAAWRLQRALWHRPELISKLVALGGTRMVNAAARRLDTRPAWFDEMQEIDYRRSLLAAHQSEAWTIRQNLDEPAQEMRDVVVKPYFELCAANLAAVMRRAASDIAQSRNCAIDASELDDRMRAMLPFWNRPGRALVPNLGSVWQRVGRFQAEIEATERIFAIKSDAWTPSLERSRCADGTWTFGEGKLAFSREIAAPRPMLNVPLVWRPASAGRTR
jgi:hypothetical protein